MTVSTMRCFCRTVFLGVSLLTLTGCFNRLNTHAIEQEIESEIESQSRRLSLSEVRCPRDVPRKAGAYFRCVGQLRPEGQFTINVTQQDSQGAIEWDVPNSEVILNIAKVEEKIQEDFTRAFSKRAFIDCGATYRINQPGERFECQVIGGVEVNQEQINSLFVRIDPDGNLNWYEVGNTFAPAGSTTTASTEGASETSTTEATPSTETTTSGGETAESVNQGPSTNPKGVAGSANVERPRVPNDDD